MHLTVRLMLIFIVLLQGCRQNTNQNPQDYFGGQQLVLAQAIESGKFEEVNKLAPKTELNKPGQHDMTLLFWAVGCSINDRNSVSKLKIITDLVKSGADPLQQTQKGDSSPAEFVLKSDNGEWIKAMLDGGLSTDAKDKTFNKPIIFNTLEAKNTRTLKVMIDRGANINVTDSLGDTLLMYAMDYGKYEHVLLLLDSGADPTIPGKGGWTLGNQLERLLTDTKEDDEHYQILNKIKEKLIKHGGKWPPVPVK
ncbi:MULTISPECIES: ankyrin repeat domain-containing protein [Enterobacter]|uniref:ankyrin repeat domain-containing protein n=1 Tax=Enterobacter TaxID=547 RepID=UPI000FEBBEC9|nr:MULTISPECIES: ankyrin repeat domain-containing protein [Enterobacter]MCR1300503.1 ankyrin repeat domain-containing protein [Enterobacter sp. FL1277]MCR1308438.1 ankyrin repeat domain-containing protein [Enterobacter sp. BT1271]MCR1311499.1 ankyrin repeat domain-containing protein [Enterobacter sp. BT855]MCR1324850.1 ankyrin repeat domain-containing protein [Enterobacter sp. BT1268]MCR1327284.1 ankyrin repeat domain-containing protein [Enterobacter sp. BT1131]